jgi:demethylmenaquinone methyltransferase/2-methoxy-6-polyprenyl-1,4-benzoquinol methylase
MMAQQDEDLLAEQAAYYRARAAEYDEWWQRLGRYDRGEDATLRWRAEVREIELALGDADLVGDVVELACGTGWWTEQLARTARSLTCIDASTEVLAINRERLSRAGLRIPRYELADLFQWRPDRRFDAVFFSFWLSHVPLDRFEAFWASVACALRPDGKVFFIDSALEKTSTARDHGMPDEAGVQERRLNDGSTYRILKLFHEPAELSARLETLGWRATVRKTASYFLLGEAYWPGRFTAG